jgi:RND superfamily putative drug exporter
MGVRIAALVLGRRSRWVVIGAWLLLALALVPLQPKLQTVASDESHTFFTRGADSTVADRLLDTRFSEGSDATAVIAYLSTRDSIYSHFDRVSADAERLCATETLPALKGVAGPDGTLCGELGHTLSPQAGPSPLSRDERMMLISVANGRDDTESIAADVAAIRKLVPGPDGGALRSYVTGAAGFDADRSAAVEGIDGTLLAITGVLVLVLMLLTYRSPLIAVLMLGVVGIAYVIATGLVYGLVSADVTTVSGQSTAILIVLMFGAGTDYCLLIVSRFRDELRRTGDVDAAMRRASARTGPAIFASGGIVVAAMLVLALADFNATREMGPLLALGVVVMMACGLTLLPALLSVFGRRAFWPSIPRVEDHAPRAGTGWTRVGRLVRRRPGLLATLSIAVLVAGALGNIGGRGYLDLSEQYRDPPESVQGQELIRARFDPPGRVAPLDVVSAPERALEVRDALQQTDGVATADTDAEARDGDLISSEVTLDIDPFSTRAMDMVPKLREVASKAADGKFVVIGGIAAENYDNQQALRSDAKLIVPLVLLLILLVLIALLRSLVAPLYVVGTVVLSFAFALGASSLVFTHVFGQPDSDPNHAIFAFIFLVALGVDDNIFLMTRIREERRAGLSTRDAVIAGLEKTGGVITSAGLILAGTFAALMALDLEALFQVGFTVSLGLLVDAFIVRTFLVPSLALLLGEANWWPSFVPRKAKDVALSSADR